MFSVKDSWYDLYCEEVIKNEKLTKDLKQAKATIRSLNQRLSYMEKNQEKMVETAVEKATGALKDTICDMQKKIEQLQSVLNNDSTNSGISTALTPINKEKHIPNSRTHSGKKKGGQKNHPKSKLSAFQDDEITEYVDHTIDVCSVCGETMVKTAKYVYKDEFEFDVILKKIRHRFIEMICPNCGNIERMPIPDHLKEENQYGYGVQALALTLMNEGYVSMGRTKEIISGLTNNEINLSVGYIAKLQKRLHDALSGFNDELKRSVIRMPIVHWDDTVIMIDKKRACLRFYGDDKIAYYRAHMHKDKEGIDEDQILVSLDEKTYVVHDHNKINYNEEYVFQNVECCAHLLRDMKKVVDNLGHEWAKEMIGLFVEENQKRKKHDELDYGYISLKYDCFICEGYMQNTEDEKHYYADTELTLLKRLKEYKENYLMWACNEKIPFTNNESERSLRSSKTKMKVSGQFSNIENARYFATIKSYIETGHRHGMNSMYLIKRALDQNAVSLDEMKKYEVDNE
ncbi:hypothetical protein DW716_23885 [Absiella sp. AM27-20]|nr:hypothetical protein DW716_23885 [Absiella sp. AM27-20]